MTKTRGCLLGAGLGIIALVALVNMPSPQTDHPAQMKITAQPTPTAEWLRSPAGELWQRHDAWSRDDCEAIAAHKVHVGMTAEQCRLAWGNPASVNRTGRAGGVAEQWCYGDLCQNALYFDNGILSSWQN
jgi:hypothetical protein